VHSVTDWLYRFSDYSQSLGTDEWGRSYGSRVVVAMMAYHIKRHTPKGAWIDVHGTERFVRNNAKKRFATDTIAAALTSYMARKRRQISIYKARLDYAERALRQAEDLARDQATADNPDKG
jgi:hypothetical protein